MERRDPKRSVRARFKIRPRVDNTWRIAPGDLDRATPKTCLGSPCTHLPPGETMTTYLEVCEALYTSWLNGQLELPDHVREAFPNENGDTTLFSPEPYLVFGDSTDPLTVITTNPGAGEPFQRRSAVGREDSPLADAPYSEVAVRLGDYYAADPAITQLARTRVKAMQTMADRLGKTGVIQFELLPFHSDTLDKNRLPNLLSNPRIRNYRDSLKSHLEGFDTVCAIANVFLPAERKPLVKAFVSLMGSRSASFETTPLRFNKNGRPTIGVMTTSENDGIRAIWCSEAYSQPPAKDLMEPFVKAVRSD